MRRIFIYILCLAVLCSAFIGCDGDAESSSDTVQESESTSRSESQSESPSELESELQGESAGVKRKYDYNLGNYILISDFKSLTVDFHRDYLQQYIDQLILEVSKKNLAVVDGHIVAEGDVVEVTYKGFFTDENGDILLDENGDEVAFSGGSGTSVCYIGSRLFIKDFEIGLIGMTLGVQKDFKAVFPEDYGVIELDGQTVVFRATVNKVCKGASYNVELVNKYYSSNYKSTDEFEAEIKGSYVKEMAKRQFMSSALVLEYPATEKALWESRISEEYFDSYLKYFVGFESRDAYIKSIIKEEMAYYAYARANGIEPQGDFSDDYSEYEDALYELVDKHLESITTVNEIKETYTSVTMGGALID